MSLPAPRRRREGGNRNTHKNQEIVRPTVEAGTSNHNTYAGLEACGRRRRGTSNPAVTSLTVSPHLLVSLEVPVVAGHPLSVSASLVVSVRSVGVKD